MEFLRGEPSRMVCSFIYIFQKPLFAEENAVAENIEEKVHNIICEQMGVNKDQLSMETSFVNDLGADSLDQVELVMEFEERFDLNIPEEEAEKIQTVGDAVKYIKEHA